ncbi:MAG: M23 family metallopeptidase [Cytophagales bacterium]|nr:M23 family metallopeptidase [Cytophagales bacterium]
MPKQRKTLSNWLTNSYLLIIRNKENFAEKTTISFNYAKLIVFVVILISILSFISFYLTTTILAKWFDPRYEQIQTNKKLFFLSFAVDSLAEELNRRDQFIMSIKKMIDGEFDTLESGNSLSYESYTSTSPVIKEIDLDYVSPVDSQLRREFENENYDLVSFQTYEQHSLSDIFFFLPLDGIVSSGYDLKNGHQGIDIVAKENEPVKCTADGTVILSSWTDDSGNVIAVQHRSNLISIYKHNSVLLKKVGNFVRTGEIIAIIGNTGALTSGPHLHFELWFDGSTVDPEEFILF